MHMHAAVACKYHQGRESYLVLLGHISKGWFFAIVLHEVFVVAVVVQHLFIILFF